MPYSASTQIIGQGEAETTVANEESGGEEALTPVQGTKRKRIEHDELPIQPRRIIFLTGGPSAASLSWGAGDLYSSPPPEFQRTGSDDDWSGRGMFKASTGISNADFSDPPPAWRVLPLQPETLSSGLTPPEHNSPPWPWQKPSTDNAKEASFVSSASFDSDKRVEDPDSEGAAALVSNEEDVEDARSQFLEQSLEFHTELQSSQVLGVDEADHHASEGGEIQDHSPKSSNPRTNSDTTTSFTTSTVSETDSTVSTSQRRQRAPPPPLTPLSEIPSASHIYAIYPQTMTVNLVVALLSVPPIRMIQPRNRNRRPLELLELTVADEMRAGFGINIWLPQTLPPSAFDVGTISQGLRESALSLRPRDIVLMRNVALGTWRGAVYGQSLRREVTRLEVLWRGTSGFSAEEVDLDEVGFYSEAELECVEGAEEGDDDDEGTGGDPLLAKARRVRKWIRDFMGPVPPPPLPVSAVPSNPTQDEEDQRREHGADLPGRAAGRAAAATESARNASASASANANTKAKKSHHRVAKVEARPPQPARRAKRPLPPDTQ